jgi:hypothetical protein
MTPRLLELAYKGYRKRMNERWEMIRYGSYYAMMPHVKKNSLQIGDLTLPHDQMGEKKRLTSDMIMKVKKIDG